MTELIDFESYPVNLIKRILLQDKATKQNIIWATNSYKHLGFEYSDNSPIQEYLISGINKWIVQPRVQKNVEQQQKRTRTKAEVFTPAWLCNKMNNLCDEQWFCIADVFNTEVDRDWQTNPEKIEFPNSKNWQNYVDLRKLEITCGEAPYLCSRYDTSTGQIIPINNRIGILDRKLRVINENTTNREEWYKWVIRAFQSCYGYEYQGDSLLIARINMLLSFYENYKERWNEEPSKNQLKKIANIISWNLWQMDGLKGTVPNGAPNKVNEQLRFEEFTNTKNIEIENFECKLYNWRADRSLYYSDLKGVKRKMKFDFVIGNPPYQENVTNETNQAKPIYHMFVTESIKICDKDVVMITPARWYSGGIGLDKFRNYMICERHLKSLVDYPNAKECFSNISIGGGVCYFVLSKAKTEICKITNIQNGIETTMERSLNDYPILVRYNKAISIINKSLKSPNKSIKGLISSVSPFGIGTKIRGNTTKDSEHNIKLYSSKGISYIKQEAIIKNADSFDKYKVLLSQTGAEHAGEPSKDGKFNVLSSTMKVLEPMDVCTHSYLTVGLFNCFSEATSLIKYLKTMFVRFLVLQTISSIHITKNNFIFVPLQDFTENSDIDWSKSIHEIDLQLYKKYNLDDTEIEFIEKNVKEMS